MARGPRGEGRAWLRTPGSDRRARPAEPGGERRTPAPPAGLLPPRPPRARCSPGRRGPGHHAVRRAPPELSPASTPPAAPAPADPSPAGRGGGGRRAAGGGRRARSPARGTCPAASPPGPEVGGALSSSAPRRRRPREGADCWHLRRRVLARVPGWRGGRGEEAGGPFPRAGPGEVCGRELRAQTRRTLDLAQEGTRNWQSRGGTRSLPLPREMGGAARSPLRPVRGAAGVRPPLLFLWR